MERFYIDCEFDGHNGPLLSMAIIRENGRGLYLCLADAPRELNPWVAENVWPLVHMKLPIGKTYAYVNDWGDLIARFVRCSNPVVVADSPQDARYFSEVIVTASDGGYAPFPFDGLTFEIHNVDPYPTNLPATQHNAYWDAVALRDLIQRRESLGQMVMLDEELGLYDDEKVGDAWIRAYLTRIASYILSSQRKDPREAYNPFVWSTPDNSVRTITGKPAAIRSAADLDRALAARKALRPAQKGWRTRKGAAA